MRVGPRHDLPQRLLLSVSANRPPGAPCAEAGGNAVVKTEQPALIGLAFDRPLQCAQSDAELGRTRRDDSRRARGYSGTQQPARIRRRAFAADRRRHVGGHAFVAWSGDLTPQAFSEPRRSYASGSSLSRIGGNNGAKALNRL